jgi:hypothetical protein
MEYLLITKQKMKIPKGQSEAVKQRTDNAMAERKKTKAQK